MEVNGKTTWAGAAFVSVVDGKRKLFVIKEDDKAFFMLPGGKHEAGEDDHQTLVREVGEEVGQSVKVSNISDEPIAVIEQPSKSTGKPFEFRVYSVLIEGINREQLPKRTVDFTYVGSDFSVDEVGNLPKVLIPMLVEQNMID